MLRNGKSLEEAALTRMLRLNAVITGLVTGILAGLAVFVPTLLLVIKGGNVVGPHLSLLGQFFIGYSVTFGGSLVGFAYGFLGGFAVGYFADRDHVAVFLFQLPEPASNFLQFLLQKGSRFARGNDRPTQSCVGIDWLI